MPFKSSAQQRYMYAHPEILGKKGLKEWSDKTDFKDLPEHVKHRAEGGSVEPGQKYIVGENGPEILVIPVHGTIHPTKASYSMARKARKN